MLCKHLSSANRAIPQSHCLRARSNFSRWPSSSSIFVCSCCACAFVGSSDNAARIVDMAGPLSPSAAWQRASRSSVFTGGGFWMFIAAWQSASAGRKRLSAIYEAARLVR